MKTSLIMVDFTVEPNQEAGSTAWYRQTLQSTDGSGSVYNYRSTVGGGTRYKTLYQVEGQDPLDLNEIGSLPNSDRFQHVESVVRTFDLIFQSADDRSNPIGQEHLLIVDSTIEPSVENDWNAWYNEVHLPEILECPGFITARRYRSIVGGNHRYAAVYHIESARALTTELFISRRGWGPFLGRVQPSVRIFDLLHQ